MDTTAGPFQQSRSSSLFYLLFLFFLFMMSGPRSDPNTMAALRGTIWRRSHEADRYKDWLYRNGTSAPGYNQTLDLPRSVEGNSDIHVMPAWNTTYSLPKLTEENVVQPLVTQLLYPSANAIPAPVYFHNITGFHKGNWSAMNVSFPNPVTRPNATQWANMTFDEQLQFNASLPEAQRGAFQWLNPISEVKMDALRLEMNLRESEIKSDVRNAQFVRGGLEIKRDDELVEFGVDGIHFLNNGSFFMVATPPAVTFDIRDLPALLPTNSTRNETAQIVLKEIHNRLEKMMTILNSGVPPTQSETTVADPSMNCTFYIYGQMEPVSAVSQTDLDEYEAELRKPAGVSLVNPPQPVINAYMHSPNCQLLLKVDDIQVLHMDKFWHKTVHYAALLSMFGILQTILLVRQMQKGSSPSAVARLSYWCFAIQGGMDSYSFVTHLTLGAIVDERASLSLFIPAFFASLSGLLFGLRYAASIRVATIDNPAAARLNAARATLLPSPNNNSTEDETNAAGPAQPETSPPFFSTENIPVIVFVSILLSLLLGITFFGYIVTFTVLLYSYWIPQIWTNADRGSARRALSREYVIGTTICRLFLPVYVWACPSNVLFAETTPWVWALVAYQILQMSILLLQEGLGARFFIPKALDFFPSRERWDYFPKHLPVDLESGASSLTCVICMEKIDLPGSEPEEEDKPYEEDEREALLEKTRRSSLALDLGRNIGRWSYMVPPCHHIMHTRCLEGWLAVKSECPVCRQSLPMT